MDDSLKTLGSTPIRADAPTGASARYEPEFERIQAEVGKLESVNPTGVDWKAVVADASTILSTQSKDLLVAAFLCRGLFACDGYPGLAVGLTVVRDMVQGFWDGLFPERPRARAAAADWLGEKLGAALTAAPPRGADADAAPGIGALVEELDGLLTERLADQAPSLGDMRRVLREAARQAEKPPPAAAAPKPAAASGTAAAAAPAAIESEADVKNGVKVCQDALRMMATYLRGARPDDPRPYVMLRLGAWLPMEKAPPAKDGVTQIPAPPYQQLQGFAELLSAASYAELIEQTEGLVARMPFCLDAHRLTAAALEALGNDAAREAVVATLAWFLRRFPEVVEYQFAGGIPFADEATRLWIQSDVLAGEGGGEAGGPTEAPWETAAKEAKRMAAKGRFEAGLERFDEGFRQAFARRERFLWELARARFCRDTGHQLVAVAQLEALDDQVDRFGLEEWEPGLAVEVAKLLLLCYKGLPKTKDTPVERAARVDRLRSRLGRFDVKAAVELADK